MECYSDFPTSEGDGEGEGEMGGETSSPDPDPFLIIRRRLVSS